MNTTDAKTFICCGKHFIYYPGIDKLAAPPDDKRMKIIHACDRLFAARINLTSSTVSESPLVYVQWSQAVMLFPVIEACKLVALQTPFTFMQHM
jgi:hypothetical protein